MNDSPYYYAVDGRPVGPVKLADIGLKIEAGELTVDVYVIKEGESQWRTFSVVAAEEGLKVAIPAGQPGAASQTSVNFALILQYLKDAWAAVLMLSKNPTGNMVGVLNILGTTRSGVVGLIFGLVAALSFILPVNHVIPSFDGHAFAVFIRVLFVGFLPYLCFMLLNLLLRTVTSVKGRIEQDSLVAGIAVLPIIPLNILSLFFSTNFNFLQLESMGNQIAVMISISLLAFCLVVILLYSGILRISRVAERTAVWATPLTVMITIFVTCEVIKMMIMSAVNSSSHEFGMLMDMMSR